MFLFVRPFGYRSFLRCMVIFVKMFLHYRISFSGELTFWAFPNHSTYIVLSRYISRVYKITLTTRTIPYSFIKAREFMSTQITLTHGTFRYWLFPGSHYFTNPVVEPPPFFLSPSSAGVFPPPIPANN